MSKTSRPTLKTIAQLTGLSVPGVSRALSGASDISQATRIRVREVADEIGYVPNRAGLRLRTGRTHVLSLVLSNEADVMNLTARLINSAAGALRSTSYHLIITPYFSDEDIMRPIKHVVETRAADAIIFNQIRPDDPRVAYLMENNFPFATHGRSNWAEQHAFYDFDNYTFAKNAVRGLADRGCKSISLLAPPLLHNHALEMVKGARDQAAVNGIALHVIEGLSSDNTSEHIEETIAATFGPTRSKEGIICASANSCMAVVSGLERSGLTIGNDIHVFSKEALRFLKRFRPAIQCIYEDAWRAGEFLARAAIERVEKPDSAPLQCLESSGEEY